MDFNDFLKIDMRVGKIIEIEDFERSRTPSYKVKVDFGSELGIKTSSMQAKNAYLKEELLNMEVIGVVNLPEKNIAGYISQVLILGVSKNDGTLSLLTPSKNPSLLGSKVH